MLTKTQKKAYKFICKFFETFHHSPTVEEIAQGIGIKSKGVAYRYIQALAAANLLKLIPNRRRNIVLIPIKNSAKQLCLPLLGKIAAGKPIEAITDNVSIDLYEVLGLDNISNRYVLKVTGDSMIEEGIFDADIVICEHCDHANNGDIVVALIDNQETTLKRIQYNTDNTIALWPANKKHQPLIYPAERVVIQGKFIGLLRIMR